VVSFVSYYWFISLHFWTLFMLRTSTNLHLLWDAYIYRTEDTGHERPASKASRATMRREPSSTASKCKLKLKYLKQRLASLLSPSPSTSSVVLVVLASSSSPSSSASSLSCSRACYPGNYVPIRVVWDFRWEVDEECARAFPLEGLYIVNLLFFSIFTIFFSYLLLHFYTPKPIANIKIWYAMLLAFAIPFVWWMVRYNLTINADFQICSCI